ncbi:glutamylcysteine synthetase [Acetobacterium tundrae]|uniref:glutamate--cysteine ligase n=1 Tax=Acetobacterium tundrae TaxID=132932 RepID=A0ABR6WH60_9FIRM|nr:glutamylcysteine synthetase [Acetobacterium tundrae]MBC3795800.1 glutamylcysteine synthetase [Acetobacterium tundrae]
MNENIVLETLYEKYISPTKKKRDKYIGIEIEIPIVNLDGEPVDFSVVHRLTDAFAFQFGMEPIGVDDDGYVYSLQNHHNGDNFSYDCSYNNLELSMGKEQNLNLLYERFKTYYLFINDFMNPYNYTLTGMGINPYRKTNFNVPIPNERYRMLFHHLESYKDYIHPHFFHSYPDYGMFSSASQVQIDVDHADLLDTINAFSKLEPIKALLFSNSVMPEDENKTLCVRDMFWEKSMHGVNPKNIGMFDRELTSEEDLFDYIKETSLYCIMREGKYINFTPIPLLEYFNRAQITGEFWNGETYEKITFQPQIEDLQYHRTFKFEDLTFRGTIEFRSCCCQPIADSMTVGAFHIGLIAMLDQLKALLDSDHVLYGHGLATTELRQAFCRGEVPAFINEDDLQSLVLSILDLAHEGLEKRGLKESHFLEPLYDRARRRSNPAIDYLNALANHVPVQELVLQYAAI